MNMYIFYILKIVLNYQNYKNMQYFQFYFWYPAIQLKTNFYVMVSMLYVLYRLSKYLYHISHPLKSISFNSIVVRELEIERERDRDIISFSKSKRERRENYARDTKKQIYKITIKTNQQFKVKDLWIGKRVIQKLVLEKKIKKERKDK